MQPRRNPDGRTRVMTPLGEALRKWLRESRAKERAGAGISTSQPGGAGQSIFDAWRRVVGEDVAGRTRVIAWRGGELLVEVSSAPLLNELSTYYAPQILESLREVEELRTVHRLRFRAGSF